MLFLHYHYLNIGMNLYSPQVMYKIKYPMALLAENNCFINHFTLTISYVNSKPHKDTCMLMHMSRKHTSVVRSHF